MNLDDELIEFMAKLEKFSIENCPSWLTPNSYYSGIIPGHNLDLMQISFDYKVDRSAIMKFEIPDSLKDPSKPELTVVK